MGTGTFAQDIGGEELNIAPDLKFPLSAEYTIPAGGLPFDSFVIASCQWQDDVNLSRLADSDAKRKNCGVLDLEGLVQLRQGGYKATLIVNKVLDEEFV
ncbi:MAG: hypothetical protein P8L31_10825 [Pseudomonadales bacterium]|nr:hypothetical protein [Pseudomonadales bacterium]